MPNEPRKIAFADVRGPVEAAGAADKALMRESLELGDSALYDTEERDTATAFHILAKRADGYEGCGVALDNFLVGVKPITPVLGIISEYYPEDPDDSPELPEVAETRANYPLNSEVVLTDAVSLNHEFFLRYPNPLGPIGNGMEGRTQRMTLINTDPAWSAMIRLAPFVDGVNRQALWKTGFANVSLAPGDELRVRAEWYNGRVILEHEKRVATWNAIALRSSGMATGTNRTTTGLLAADMVFAALFRNGGSNVPFPSGHAYEAPTGAPFETDGRLLLTGPRADGLCWERVVANGDLNTGVFSAVGRIATSGWSNIAAVRRWAGFKADSGVSLAHPHLSGPVAPGAMLIGATMAANHALAAGIVPAGAVIDQFHDGGGSPGISFALWHIAGAATHTPAPSTVTSGAQSSVVVEAIPTRSN